MPYFYQYLDNALTFLLLTYILWRIFGIKKNVKSVSYFAGATVSYLFFYYLPVIIHVFSMPIPYYYFSIAATTVGMIWAQFCLTGRFISKLRYLVFYITFFYCTKTLFVPLYVHFYTMDYSVYVLLDLCTIVITYLILFGVTHIFLRYPIEQTTSLHLSKQMAILICPASIYVVLLLIEPQITIPLVYVHALQALLLMIILFIIYFMYASIIAAYEKKVRLNDALAQTQTQLVSYRYNVFLDEQLKKERHELKNNYFYILSLLHEKKYSQIDDYLTSHLKDLDPPAKPVSTNNTMIDYILNRKMAEARKQKIELYTDLLIPAHVSVNESALCTILLNLLDNAMEASQKEKDSDVHIIMRCIQSYLLVKVSNKVSSPVLTENPSLATTKSNSADHGLGLKIVADAVKKNDGILDIKMEDCYFTVTVMLPLFIA